MMIVRPDNIKAKLFKKQTVEYLITKLQRVVAEIKSDLANFTDDDLSWMDAIGKISVGYEIQPSKKLACARCGCVVGHFVSVQESWLCAKCLGHP